MAPEPQGKIRVGVGGWTFAPWRGGTFFPKGLPQDKELAFASRNLTTIEVNGTYYRTQTPETFARWHDETPEGFVFSVKAPRYCTNRRVLATAGESVHRFTASGIDRLKDKLGCILWQFLPSKAFDPKDFGQFLALLPAQAGACQLRHMVEVRHPSFAVPEFTDLVQAHGVGVVRAGDAPFPEIDAPLPGLVYARIMGTTQKEPEGYSKAALDRWAERARGWAGGGKGPPRDVFLYVIRGHKPHNPSAALALIRRLSPGSGSGRKEQ